MLRLAYREGIRAGLVKHGLAKQPSIKSTGVKNPSDTKDLPDLPKAKNIPLRSQAKTNESSAPSTPEIPKIPDLFKSAFNVGLGASSAPMAESAGAVRGDPPDEGRRQRSVVDRTFQENEDSFATSSMPLPGSVSP